MDAVTSYFDAERAESVLFIAIGALALVASAYFLFFRRQRFWRGLALPLAAVALIQLTVGTTVFLRSPEDDARVHAALQSDRAHIAAIEIPRMQVVARNFVVYRWVEIGLLLAGVAAFFAARSSSLLRGAGIGLALQAGLMLALDLFAERRADVYLRWLSGA